MSYPVRVTGSATVSNGGVTHRYRWVFFYFQQWSFSLLPATCSVSMSTTSYLRSNVPPRRRKVHRYKLVPLSTWEDRIGRPEVRTVWVSSHPNPKTVTSKRVESSTHPPYELSLEWFFFSVVWSPSGVDGSRVRTVPLNWTFTHRSLSYAQVVFGPWRNTTKNFLSITSVQTFFSFFIVIVLR